MRVMPIIRRLALVGVLAVGVACTAASVTGVASIDATLRTDPSAQPQSLDVTYVRGDGCPWKDRQQRDVPPADPRPLY